MAEPLAAIKAYLHKPKYYDMEKETDELLIDSISNFITEQSEVFSNEEVYGFCFIYPEEGHSVFCAIGTEERLNKSVATYAKKGYCNKETGNTEDMNEWLRWGSPEDGWAGYESKTFDKLNKHLSQLVKDGKVKLYSDFIRKRITKNIKQIKKIVPQSDEIVFVFSNGWFDTSMKSYVKRVNKIDIYTKWLREQCKSEYLYKKFEQ